MSSNVKCVMIKPDIISIRIRLIRKILIIICILLITFSVPIAEQFSYEVIEEYTEQEEYQRPAGTLRTYFCYVTEYGNCYHAKGCQYLWNRSYQTTVHEAKEQGFRACSKCTPTQRTTIPLTETAYRDVTKVRIVEKTPFAIVLFGSIGFLFVVCISSGIILRIRNKRQSNSTN